MVMIPVPDPERVKDAQRESGALGNRVWQENYEVTVGGNPGFALGPALEILDGIGDCIRIDIPLRTIATAMAVAQAACGASLPPRANGQTPDWPPAA